MKSKKFKHTEIGEIPEEWKEKSILDCLELIYGKALKEKNRKMGNIPVYGSNGIIGYHNKSIIDFGGIVIGRKGSVGEVQFSKVPFWAIDTTYFVKLKPKNDLNFWYYFLLTLQLKKMNSHSAVPGLNRDQVYQIKAKIPFIAEQQAISKILSDLDAKIELNKKMNKTLELIGETLFRKWFTDFEFPNEKGKPYKSSGGEMVDSELGEIPKGWKVVKLKEVLKSIESGRRPKGGIDSNLKEGIPSIGAENIKCLGYYDYSSTKYISREFFEQMKQGIVQNEDVLLYKDGAQLGRKTMFGKDFPFKVCCVNEHVFILRANEKLNQFFLYFWLDRYQVTENIKNLNANSAQPGINKESVRTLNILVPKKDILNNFNKFVKNIIEKLFLNCLESQMLSQIRDQLLPKLMSGKIRVK